MISILAITHGRRFPDCWPSTPEYPGVFIGDAVTSVFEALMLIAWNDYDTILFDHRPAEHETEFIYDMGMLREKLPLVLFIPAQGSGSSTGFRTGSLHFRESCPARDRCAGLLRQIDELIEREPFCGAGFSEMFPDRNNFGDPEVLALRKYRHKAETAQRHISGELFVLRLYLELIRAENADPRIVSLISKAETAAEKIDRNICRI